MNVTLYGCHNNFTLAYGSSACLCKVLFDYIKALLSCVCTLDKLWEEDFILFKIFTHSVKCGDKHFVYNLHCIGCFKKLCGCGCTFVFKSVINSRKNINIAVCLFNGSGRTSIIICVDKFKRVLVNAVKHTECSYSTCHRLNIWVDNRQIKSLFHSHCKESSVDKLTVRKSERNV